MDTTIELRGTMVLIHPDLTCDPAGMRNGIGVITAYEPENDNVYVGFGGYCHGLYSTDAVLVLRNAPGILCDLAHNRKKLSAYDYGTVYKIGLLQDNRSPANTIAALELVKSNPVARLMTTQSLQHLLGLEKNIVHANER